MLPMPLLYVTIMKNKYQFNRTFGAYEAMSMYLQALLWQRYR